MIIICRRYIPYYFCGLNSVLRPKLIKILQVKYFISRLLIVSVVIVLTSEYTAAQSKKLEIINGSIHYVISAEITFASCMFLTLKNPDISLTKKYLVSAGVGICAGVSKELIDLLVLEGSFDFLDIGIDLLGIGTGLLLHYIVFDRKIIRSNISLNVNDSNYLVSVKFYF